MQGWTGKRLHVDLDTRRSRVEEIPRQDLDQFVGGRGLNGKYFLDAASGSPGTAPSVPPIALSVGPLAGTPAPCSAWTSISTFSPFPASPRYVHASLPGHWGAQLKFAGFDQVILHGRADAQVYVMIDGGKPRFESARSLWGKDTVETTVGIEEAERDRDAEILCIGPAGENLVAFANVTHRCSWTADHAGLGAVFGAKNLKAVAVRGTHPVHLHQHEPFLRRCLSLHERIRRDPSARKLGEEGAFFFLGQENSGLGLRNYAEQSSPSFDNRWRIDYLTKHLSRREGCFSCPIHCGRVSEVNGRQLGGVHLENAWSLGPRIGTTDWGKTLPLLRRCQLLGLDPSSAGSLLSWVIDCCEKGILSTRELGLESCDWGDDEACLNLIEQIIEGKALGEILRAGAFGAARRMGKGMEWVPHSRGLDLPARDPRSSKEFAMDRLLFPMEWDALQSFGPYPTHGESGEATHGLVERAMASQRLRVLAGIHGVCPLVFARLQLITPSDVEGLMSEATGGAADSESAARRTMQVEQTLSEKFHEENWDPIPDRFFKGLFEKDELNAIAPFLPASLLGEGERGPAVKKDRSL